MAHAATSTISLKSLKDFEMVKNKHKIISALSGGTNTKCKKLRTDIHEILDETIFKWFCLQEARM